MAGNAQVEGSESAQNLTKHQIEQLLKLLTSASKPGSKTEEELDSSFAGMLTCYIASVKMKHWVIDIGASSHMVSDITLLDKAVKSPKDVGLIFLMKKL